VHKSWLIGILNTHPKQYELPMESTELLDPIDATELTDAIEKAELAERIEQNEVTDTKDSIVHMLYIENRALFFPQHLSLPQQYLGVLASFVLSLSKTVAFTTICDVWCTSLL